MQKGSRLSRIAQGQQKNQGQKIVSTSAKNQDLQKTSQCMQEWLKMSKKIKVGKNISGQARRAQGQPKNQGQQKRLKESKNGSMTAKNQGHQKRLKACNSWTTNMIIYRYESLAQAPSNSTTSIHATAESQESGNKMPFDNQMKVI